MLIEHFAEMFNAQMSSHIECRAEKSNFWKKKKNLGYFFQRFPPAHQLNNSKTDWQAQRRRVSAPSAVRYTRHKLNLLNFSISILKYNRKPAVVSCWTLVRGGETLPVCFMRGAAPGASPSAPGGREEGRKDRSVVCTSSKCPVCVLLRVGITLTSLRRASWIWSRRPWTSPSNR